ncbi:MAG: 3'-5' exonuclease [Chlamydiia bacterium]|nr:3'-5' exonuclease [Chlamydiia bacterium]
MKILFLDIETTGLNPDKHRSLEIAFKAIELRTNKTVAVYNQVIEQPLEVWTEHDESALAINGFTWEEVLKGKTEKVVAGEIIEQLNQLGFNRSDGVFLCQNPSFDRAFFSQIVNADLQEGFRWPYHWLDLASMYFVTKIHAGDLRGIENEGLSKDIIASNYKLPKEAHPHRAMNGVNHLIQCYQAIVGTSLTSYPS